MCKTGNVSDVWDAFYGKTGNEEVGPPGVTFREEFEDLPIDIRLAFDPAAKVMFLDYFLRLLVSISLREADGSRKPSPP